MDSLLRWGLFCVWKFPDSKKQTILQSFGMDSKVYDVNEALIVESKTNRHVGSFSKSEE